jgi:hypothetical protein
VGSGTLLRTLVAPHHASVEHQESSLTHPNRHSWSSLHDAFPIIVWGADEARRMTAGLHAHEIDRAEHRDR